MRSGERAILAGERCCGDLSDHEAGIEARLGREERGEQTGERVRHLLDAPLRNPAQRRYGNGDLVGGHRERLAVEIAAADDVALAILLDEYERIVGRAVEFDERHFAGLDEGITDGAVNLRGAAQAIGILNAGIFFGGAMGLANEAAFVEMREIACRTASAGIGACVHDAGIEGAWAASEGVEGKRSGDVGSIGKLVGFAEGETQQGEHTLRAVEKRKALLGFESDRSDACAVKGLGTRELFVFEVSLAFADDDLRQMGKRGEVSGSADGALRRDNRMDARVEHCAEGFDEDWADSAEALRKGIGAKKHHGASFRGGEWGADSASVGTHEIDLELADLFGRNTDRSELAETRVNAVGGLVGGDEALDDGARGVHARGSVRGEGDGLVMESDAIELVERKVVAGEKGGHEISLRGKDSSGKLGQA